MIRKVLLGLLIVFLVLVGVLLFNTLMLSSKQMVVQSVETVAVSDDALDRLSGAIRYRTISHEGDVPPDSAAFLGFHRHLSTSFPLIDSLLTKEVVNEYSLLYTWKGTDASTKPIILMSHQDVVPIDEPTREEWSEGPFSGMIKNGKIWGRGTMDDKGSLMAVAEGIEMLLAEGYETKRTIYLAFGHDEEVGGPHGAAVIAQLLKERGVMAEFTLDEGGFLADGFIPGLSKTLAMVNVAEKGFVSFELTVRTSGGHSSSPPRNNTIGMLAKAIVDLEENQLPYKEVPPLDIQIATLGPELGFMGRLAMANTWLFGTQVLEGFNAHTTTAPTIINGGIKDNVIPTEAKATVNFRILPGETTETVKQHIEEVIANDQITVELVGDSSEPSPVSDAASPSYELLHKTIRQIFPEAAVVPGLLGGGTDSKWFYGVSENVYRFYPIRITQENMTGFHGINEHIEAENYKECVQFVYHLIKNVNE